MTENSYFNLHDDDRGTKPTDYPKPAWNTSWIPVWTTDHFVWIPIEWDPKNGLLGDWTLQAYFPFRVASHMTPFLNLPLKLNDKIITVNKLTSNNFLWIRFDCKYSNKRMMKIYILIVFSFSSNHSFPPSHKIDSFF